MPETIPLGLQTTYRDLVERHARRPAPELEGSVLRVANKSNAYWVVRRRIGDAVVERRIGPDNDAGRARADTLRRQNEARGAVARPAQRQSSRRRQRHA